MGGWGILTALLLLSAEGDTLVSPYMHEGFSERFFKEKGGIKDTTIVSGGYTFLSRAYRDVVLDTLDIMPLNRYLSQRISESGREWLVDALLEENKKESQESQGLIPDVEIPVHMPGNLAFLGEGGKLQIDGQNSITVGGRGDYPIGYVPTEQGIGTPFSLEMDQTMQVKLTGSVGKKIKVLIDHDSERMNQAKNQVVLKYEGEEDEVVQLLEAGDTKVDFPSTQYASFPGGSKTGLFGVKGIFKMGGLQATVLAARDRGSRESKQFSGGAEIRVETIAADGFIKRKFYQLGVSEDDSIVSLVLFLDDNNPANDIQMGAKPGVAYYNADPNSSFYDEGQFHQLWENKDYIRYQYYHGWIELTQSLSPGQKLGAYMVLVNKETGDTTVVGDVSGDTFRLKLIAPSNLPTQVYPDSTSQDTLEVWNYELKNVYYISGSMAHQPPQVNIFWDAGQGDQNPVGINGKNFTEITGIDPDRKGYVQEITVVDGVPRRLLDYREGLLIFPEPMPFAQDELGDKAEDLIYYKIPLDPDDEQKFYIVVQYTEKVDQIFLAPDIQEGSVVVKVNGQNVPESAYRVDYNMGFLTILDDSWFSDPNAVIDISYDVVPTFSLTQRSLLGLRLDYEYSDNITMGSSLIMSSEATAQIRPRINEAPKRAAVAEADIQGEFFYDWLTRGLDRLPLISTDEDSKLTLQAEGAQSFPDPNTMGEAYLDDMESIRDSRSLSTTRTSWKFGSLPPGKDTSGYVARATWYNPRHKFKRGDVYEGLPPDEADDYEEGVLEIILRPSKTDPDSNWISFNDLLSKSGADYSTMEFLEIYAKGTGAALHIDLGYDIPEDAPRRGRDGSIQGWGILDNEDADSDYVFNVNTEDSGLDGAFGSDKNWKQGDPDEGNDDYSVYNSDSVNGTEGNGRWDNEDLDQNGSLNQRENYFSWTVDLDTTQYSSEYNGWKYYKIPLRDSSRYEVYGTPSFDMIRYARLWIDGFSDTDTVWIAKMDITGNQWFSQGTTVDSSGLPVNQSERFRAAYVNNKENVAEGYTPPPGARIMETEPGKYEQEGSLALIYEGILPGHSGLAKKGLYDKHDLLDYKNIAFWVKPRPSTAPPYPTLVFRMGTDSSNYYEYRYKISSSEWQEVRFSLDSLTRFKKSVLDTLSDSSALGRYFQEGSFGFKGSPNIGQVNFYWFGIYNDENTKLSGEVWVDELRATDPHTEGGRAYRGQATLQVADLATLDLSGSREEADFQGLSDASRRTSTASGATYSALFNADKLFPKAWGLSIPLKFQGTSTNSLPKYSTGGDVLLSPEESREQRGVSGSESYSASVSKKGSQNLLGKWFLDPTKLQVNRSIRHDFEPASRTMADDKSLTTSYSFTPTIKNPPKIFNKQIRYLPNSYSLSYTATDNWSYSLQQGGETENFSTVGTYSGDISWTPINNISGRYSITKEKDYRADTLLEGTGPQGPFQPAPDTAQKEEEFRFPWKDPLGAGWEAGHDENLSGSYNITFFRGFVAPRVSYSARYSEDHSATKQIRDSLGELIDNRDVDASTSTDVTVSNKILSSVFGLLAKFAPRDTTGQATLLERLHRGLGNTTVGYTFSRNSHFSGLYGRPGWRFRYGFTERTGYASLYPASSNITETNAFDLSQGFNFSNLSVRSSWDLTFTRTQNITQPTWSKSLTNPRLNITLSNLNFMMPPEYRKQITSASVSSGFSQRFDWDYLLPDMDPQSYTLETDHSPLAQLNLNLKGGTSISVSYDLRKTKTQTFGLTPTLSKGVNNDLSLNLSHTFQSFGGFKFPWAEGRVFKLESELRLNFKFSKSSSVDSTYQDWDPLLEEWGTVQMTSGQETTSYGVDGTYKFSSSVTGTVSFTNDITLNKKSGLGNKTMKLLFTVNFKF